MYFERVAKTQKRFPVFFVPLAKGAQGTHTKKGESVCFAGVTFLQMAMMINKQQFNYITLQRKLNGDYLTAISSLVKLGVPPRACTTGPPYIGVGTTTPSLLMESLPTNTPSLC